MNREERRLFLRDREREARKAARRLGISPAQVESLLGEIKKQGRAYGLAKTEERKP